MDIGDQALVGRVLVVRGQYTDPLGIQQLSDLVEELLVSHL
jgi:hypothetical protein